MPSHPHPSPRKSSLLGVLFEDELIWSYQARLRERYPNFDFEDLLGSAPSYRKAFPTQLSSWANSFNYACAPDVATLIKNHTFYPFALPEITKAAAHELIQALAHRTFPVMAPGHLIHSTEFRLRICPQCVTEDLKKTGCAFWHRMHQLPTVRHCHIHKLALKATRVKSGQRELVSAHAELDDAISLNPGNLLAQRAITEAYAVLSSYLNTPFRDQIEPALKVLLKGEGYYVGHQVAAKLEHEIEKRFGADIAGETGIGCFPSRLRSWLTVPKLAMLCDLLGLKFGAFLSQSAQYSAPQSDRSVTPRLKYLEAQVRQMIPAVARNLKGTSRERVSPWVLANTLAEKFGPGFATFYSSKPNISVILRDYAESRDEFRTRVIAAA